MRKITIIGGGQSGLQLGIGLLQNGYGVRMVQNRTGAEIAAGRVLSSQCMFSNALAHEAALGIDFWSNECPPVQGINFIVPNPDGSGTKAVDWAARLDRDAQSVDQRVKDSALDGRVRTARRRDGDCRCRDHRDRRLCRRG